MPFFEKVNHKIGGLEMPSNAGEMILEEIKGALFEVVGRKRYHYGMKLTIDLPNNGSTIGVRLTVIDAHGKDVELENASEILLQALQQVLGSDEEET